MRRALLATLLVMAGASMASSRKFEQALSANGPDSEHAAEMKLYDPILGDWDATVIDYDSDGKPTKSEGEWHFAWVLEGRAIQDVWIVPPRGIRKAGQTVNNRYGTSIRVYDPHSHAWNVTWINPVSGSFNQLVGRKEGDDIMQEGTAPDGSLIRWVFSEITPVAFRWRGESSSDGGKTWRLRAEFFGRRQRANTK
jgi:hypothetical protein